MKISAATLKNLDYKQLVINHGEKFVLALIVGFVVFGLLGTSWGRYGKSPDELIEQTDSARDRIIQAEWTEAEQNQFKMRENLRQAIAAMLTPLETAQFQYQTEFISPLYQKKEKIEEPKWLAVDGLIAVAGRAVLSVSAPTGDETPDDELIPFAQAEDKPEERTNLADTDIPDEFRMPNRNRGRSSRSSSTPPDLSALAPNQPGTPSLTGLFGGLGEENEGGILGRRRSDDEPRRSKAGRGDGDYGRGYRYVSVRGVFPLEDQLKELAKAMHELPAEVADEFAIIDFQLQRQTAVPGPDPWAGEWTDVDLQLAAKVLDEAAAFAPDPVHSDIIDSVITMPLPSRVTGIWSEVTGATHPAIDNFTLSKEEMERELRINQKMIEEHQRLRQQQQQEDQPVTRRGWSTRQVAIRDIRKEVTSDPESLKRVAQGLDDGGQPDGSLKRQIEDRVSAAGRLVLFRYLDFDVEPGNAYRYRVRLVLKNPNHDRLLEEVAHPGVVEGQTRETEWSEPTEPVIVPVDTLYFVEGVSPGRGHVQPTAAFDIFQWKPDTGTVIRPDRPMKVDLGAFIGGRENDTLVLDPAQGSFERQEVEFRTGDVLIDLAANPQVDLEDHPDLGLPRERRGRINEVPAQVLVVDEHGELKSIDPISKRRQHQRTALRFDFERRVFQPQLEEFREEERQGKLDALSEKYGDRGDNRQGRNNDRDRRDQRSRGRENPIRVNRRGSY